MTASITSPLSLSCDMIKMSVDSDEFNYILQSNGYDEFSIDKIEASNSKEKLSEYIMEILGCDNLDFDDIIKRAEIFKRNQKRLVDEIQTILTQSDLSFEDIDKVNRKINFVTRWYDKLILTGYEAFSRSLFATRNFRSKYHPKNEKHFLMELDVLFFVDITNHLARHVVVMIMNELDNLAHGEMELLASLVFGNIIKGEMRFSKFDKVFIKKYDKVLRAFKEGDQKLIKQYGGNPYRGT